jgi:hypothetical protein
MKKNVGGIDKAARIIFGAAIIVWGIFSQSWLGLIGLVPLSTGLANFCPIYLPFGISSCKKKE